MYGYQQSGPIIGQVNFISFHGASDDLIYVIGNNLEEEFYPDSNGRAEFEVSAPGGASRLRVTAQYLNNATWAFGLALAEDGAGFPLWPITYLASPVCRHSVQLRLEVPYATMVKRVDTDE